MIFISFTLNYITLLKPQNMANTGKTVATLLIGAAVGAAVGYILATDSDKRQEGMDKIKDRLSNLKTRFGKKTEDLEQEIYNA